MRIIKTAEDYTFIQAWGESMTSFQSYIDNEKIKALDLNLPLDTIYFHENRTGDIDTHLAYQIADDKLKIAIYMRAEILRQNNLK